MAEPSDDEGGGASGGAGAGGSAVGGSGGVEAPTCGDGVREGAEVCDGDDLGGQSCETFGFAGGSLSCETCVLDTTGCYDELCGNGTQEGGEECDGTDLGGQSCGALGFSQGTLACSDMCLFAGCYDPWAEDFEGGTLSAGMTTSGSAGWLVSTTSPHAGSFCGASGNIGDSQSSSLFVTLVFEEAGTISFWHRESTEVGYDYLDVYVGPLLKQSWSGDNGWALATIALNPGTHTIEWRYEKDTSVSEGSDTVWIDDITVNGGHLP